MSRKSRIDAFIDPDRLPAHTKVAPDAIERTRFERWMAANANIALRCIAAQPGAGKTTAIAVWARSTKRRTLWIDCERGLSSVARSQIEHARDVEIVFDQIDAATPEFLTFIMELCENIPQSVRLICAGRSPGVLEMMSAAHARSAKADPQLLRFDAYEVAALCKRHEMTVSPVDATTLARMTTGWSTAVAGAIRTAAYHRLRLQDGLARWRRSDTPALRAVIDRALQTAPSDAAALLVEILTGHVAPNEAALAALCDAGLFVEMHRGKPRLNPIVAGVAQGVVAEDQVPETEHASGRAVLDMTSLFRVVVAGQEVTFNRRRDAQIVQFLALRPSGTATRAQIIEAFWPNADRHLAGGALRTACSTIRRAIAHCVGYENVNRYFRTSGSEVELVSENVLNPIERFRRHCELAAVAEERGDFTGARLHWSTALRLYPVLPWTGEPPSSIVSASLRALEELRESARSRVKDAG